MTVRLLERAGDQPLTIDATGLRLPHPTGDTAELISHATAVLRRIYRSGPHYAKCGVLCFVREETAIDDRTA